MAKKKTARTAKNGRKKCAHLIEGKYGKEDRPCSLWAAPGSKFCRRHGAASAHSKMETSVDEGKHLRESPPGSPVGLRRVLDGKFADLWDCLLTELGDDDLSHELATLRASLATQLQETTSRYEQWVAEAEKMADADRVEYWRAYNVMLTRVRQTVDAIRKVVQTIADVRAKQEGNVLTMVQVVALVGEIIAVMTEIIGDDTDKLEALRGALDKLDWLPK